MTDFGGKLRQARERRGVSLRQIAASTKISVAALEALERNDTSRLPGGIFSRAFVRSYAAEIGLDPDDTVREFLELFQQGGAPEGARAGAAQPAYSSEEDTGFDERQRLASVLIKIIVAIFVVAALILYFTWRQTSAASRTRPAEQPPSTERAPTRGAAVRMPWIPDFDRL